MTSRTTIDLDDDLLSQLRERATSEHAPVDQLISEAIRNWLLRPKKESNSEPFIQKTYDMGRPLIATTKATTLAFEMEDDETIRKMGFGQ